MCVVTSACGKLLACHRCAALRRRLDDRLVNFNVVDTVGKTGRSLAHSLGFAKDVALAPDGVDADAARAGQRAGDALRRAAADACHPFDNVRFQQLDATRATGRLVEMARGLGGEIGAKLKGGSSARSRSPGSSSPMTPSTEADAPSS